jgi:hypothetical protein
MNAKNDLILFIGILLVLFLAWVFSGGPERSSSREGIFLEPPYPLGTGEIYNIPGLPGTRPINTDGESGGASEEVEGASESILGFLDNFKDIKEYGEVSPMRGTVTLIKGGAGSSKAATEYVIIKAANNNQAQVNITGWRLESAKSGFGGTIGTGAYLPYSGRVNDVSDILLVPGAVANVVTGRSPIGASFRTNLCTGYFEQFQDFTPSLTMTCPTPRAELEAHPDHLQFNDACDDFVGSMRRCELATKSVPVQADDACRAFIAETLTYAGCVADYRNTNDFYRKEWYVYLGFDGELWKSSREVIVLTDAQGKVVDVLSY